LPRIPVVGSLVSEGSSSRQLVNNDYPAFKARFCAAGF
jgi:hypothetical protein